MRVDMQKLNPGSWFSFDDDDPDFGRICLRVCPKDKDREFEETTSKKVVKTFKGLPYDSTERDPAAYDALLWDYVIVDWEGIIDANGDQVPCTKEHKLSLMGNEPEFSRFVIEQLSLLKTRTLKEREGLEKNS